MTTYAEGNRISDFLKWEVNPQFTRETVTILSGQNLVAGTVVGKDGNGKYLAYDDDNVDGSQVAAGILLYDVDASGGDKKGVILKRGPAIIAAESLTWAATNDATDKANGLADLVALDIIARPQA